MANPNGNPQNLKSYKPKWQSGKTRTIRVPIAIADRVLEAAKIIDENPSHTLTQVNQATTAASKKEVEAIAILEAALNLKANAGGAIKTEIRRALELLKDSV